MQTLLTVDKGNISIVEINDGGELKRVAFGYSSELDAKERKGILVESVISTFPERECFALQLPFTTSDNSEEVPLTVLYRMQRQGLIKTISNLYEDVWDSQVEDFKREFPPHIRELWQKNGKFFTDLEQSGELVAAANDLAIKCRWQAVVVGVGKVSIDVSGPFR